VSRPQRAALIVILLVAAALRLTGLDWDELQHHHPDERYIAWVATTIEFPALGSLGWADLEPTTATFNPFRWPPDAASEGIVVFQDERRDFAYGHVPLYLGVLATRLAERVGPALVPLLPAGWSLTADVLNGAGRIEFHHLTAVGRALTALFDDGNGAADVSARPRLYGVTVGLLAAALLALTVLRQLALLYQRPLSDFLCRGCPRCAGRCHSAADAAVASNFDSRGAGRSGRRLEFPAVLLLLPLLWAIWGWAITSRWAEALVALAVAALVFALTNPFALLDNTCPAPAEAVRFGPLFLPEGVARNCYLQNVTEQNAMARGAADLGFTRQYEGTLPYLYFIECRCAGGWGRC
jgi:hypothetical protein